MTNAITIKTLSVSSYKTYLWAILFVMANIIVPQFFHLFNLGGKAFVPIMLFTVIAAAKFGITTAIVTALLSPITSHLIFGMPGTDMILIITLKSLVIAIIIGLYVEKYKKLSLISLAILICIASLTGFLFSLVITPLNAVNDLVISYPGIIMQIIVTYILLRLSAK